MPCYSATFKAMIEHTIYIVFCFFLAGVAGRHGLFRVTFPDGRSAGDLHGGRSVCLIRSALGLPAPLPRVAAGPHLLCALISFYNTVFLALEMLRLLASKALRHKYF